MNPRFLPLAVALVAIAPALAGCAGEDATVGEAAYPPIGYTPPAQMGTATAPGSRASAGGPAPSVAPPDGPPRADWQWASADDGAPQDPSSQGDPNGGASDNGPGDNGPGDDGTDGSNAGGPDGNGYAGGVGGGYVGGRPPGPGAGGVYVGGAGGGGGFAGGGSGAGAPGGYADADPSALTDFRSALDPYGSWAEDANYGTVWVPSTDVVGQDFTPYVSAGHWVYDHDYAWVSDYDWGWAPFHYGRWVYAQGPGWEWIPGRAYAGAWVSWRTGYDDWAYVGWAPLAPTWCWRGGVAVGMGYVPRSPYTFVGTGALFSPSLGGRVVAGPQVGVIASHTRAYVPGGVSSPGSAGRVAARPSVGGPPPSDLRIASDAVTRATTDNRGLAQARAFARPSTAMTLGARPPQGVVASRTLRGGGEGWAQGRGYAPAYRPYSGQTYAVGPSHFGGRFGAGFTGSPAGAAPMRAPSYARSYDGARPSFGAGRGATPAGSFRGYAAPSAVRSPSPSGFRSSAPAPSFHSGGASPSYRGGGGGYHGGGRGGRR
jgi:hypothetical protein